MVAADMRFPLHSKMVSVVTIMTTAATMPSIAAAPATDRAASKSESHQKSDVEANRGYERGKEGRISGSSFPHFREHTLTKSKCLGMRQAAQLLRKFSWVTQ